MQGPFLRIFLLGIVLALVFPLSGNAKGTHLIKDNPYRMSSDQYLKRGGYVKKKSPYHLSKSPYSKNKSDYFRKKSPYFPNKGKLFSGSSNVVSRFFKNVSGSISKLFRIR